ncbi:hypothetical protein Htur_5057 (plasmid) [Haloterrigena turkmenica DSM 5511]|uniref:Uncharacterized protein n=1 Tax=Haloterrigena turkmenica (strain ATCC 51198 / DSM 5511 / JCM 9101 / NCIMB 13204 / VKM B-1734 / 4k) TaxID=543526 RepID=D2S3J7_HALTV|nr:hypothetical protein [Haloterrigena turkmenica]ADB63944.1 hypothetical protein Htur_5057 [Haloterrigena turkmenica DSM 5511]
MSSDDPPTGPFHYTGPDGFRAWGYRFPSGFIILEWIPESVPESDEKITGGHQSIYHSYEDFRTVCTGEIHWGWFPDSTGDEWTPEDRCQRAVTQLNSLETMIHDEDLSEDGICEYVREIRAGLGGTGRERGEGDGE